MVGERRDQLARPCRIQHHQSPPQTSDRYSGPCSIHTVPVERWSWTLGGVAVSVSRTEQALHIPNGLSRGLAKSLHNPLWPHSPNHTIDPKGLVGAVVQVAKLWSVDELGHEKTGVAGVDDGTRVPSQQIHGWRPQEHEPHSVDGQQGRRWCTRYVAPKKVSRYTHLCTLPPLSHTSTPCLCPLAPAPSPCPCHTLLRVYAVHSQRMYYASLAARRPLEPYQIFHAHRAPRSSGIRAVRQMLRVYRNLTHPDRLGIRLPCPFLSPSVQEQECLDRLKLLTISQVG